jgi:glycosyltransferase involved in cell wall biosynthesis
LGRSTTLTVVVNFFNMRREARRTLFSLTPAYQQDVNPADYEVIAVDNGSSEPLEEPWVTSLGDNFRYVYHDTDSRSPCTALNRVVRTVDSEVVMCIIDGARILSPKVLKYSLAAVRLYGHPFIYTLSMHIGNRPQNVLVVQGYNQAEEDALFNSLDWRSYGYNLFNISSVALSSKKGFFSQLSETNCFAMRKHDYLHMGGFDERFVGPGGGLANLDFFNRIHEDVKYSPVMLLGEATFHQFHGGIATNVPMEMHPWEEMEKEYRMVRGKPFAPSFRYPEYFGGVPAECWPFMKGDTAIP